jgi:hypothetical protein
MVCFHPLILSFGSMCVDCFLLTVIVSVDCGSISKGHTVHVWHTRVKTPILSLLHFFFLEERTTKWPFIRVVFPKVINGIYLQL